MIKILIFIFLVLLGNFGFIFFQEHLIDLEIEKIQRRVAEENLVLDVTKKGPMNLFAWNIKNSLEVRLQGSILGNNLHVKISPVEMIQQLDKVELFLPKKITFYLITGGFLKDKLQLGDKYQVDLTSQEKIPLLYKELEGLSNVEILAKSLDFYIKEKDFKMDVKDLIMKKSHGPDSWLYMISSNLKTIYRSGKFFIEVKKELGPLYKGKLLLQRDGQEIIVEGGSKEVFNTKLKLNLLFKETESLINDFREMIKTFPDETEKKLELYDKWLKVLLPLGETKSDYLHFVLEEKEEGLFLQNQSWISLKKQIDG